MSRDTVAGFAVGIGLLIGLFFVALGIRWWLS